MATVTQAEFVGWVREIFLGGGQRRLSVHVYAPPEGKAPTSQAASTPSLVTDVAAFKKCLTTYPQPHLPLPPVAASSAPRGRRGRPVAAGTASAAEQKPRRRK